MAESRTKKAKRNIGTAVIQNIINLLISMIGRIVFARVLTASYFGISGLFSNVISVLSIADLGMSTAMMYRLYKPISEHDEAKIVALVAFFKRIFLLIAAVVFGGGMALIPFLKYIINLPDNIPHLYAFYILNLLGTVMTYLFVYRTVLVSADQKNYLLVRSNIIFKIVSFILQMFALIVFKSYFVYLVIAVCINMVNNLYQNHIALKMYPFLRTIKPLKLDKDELKSIFDDIKALFLYKVCGVVQSNTDSILISVFVGTIVVGYYSNYVMIISQVITFLGIIFGNLKASIGNKLASENSIENAYRLYQILELLNYWLVLGCSIAIFVLSGPFIKLCFGEEYVLPHIVVFAIILNFYTSNIRQTLWAYRETTGIFKQTQYTTMVTAICNIVTSIIGGYLWGLFGIIIATVFSRMVYAWWKEPMVLYREYFSKNPIKYYMTYIIRMGIGIIIGSVAFFACSLVPNFNDLATLIIDIFISATIVLTGLYIVSFNTDEFRYLKEYIFRGIRK
ncbi:lipopolysaccharide biosynthesis protein [Butyrivibrio sp. LC3010]|uniref:lipopolysaccharide biosynthesis protein n=1 Tax=Butyrivibrio sp. LC3010 TaxID=1280680 RepID=UPI00041CF42F|nr:oligosaccharide flippase family protein [Butyrivibrio sp. LC3010]